MQVNLFETVKDFCKKLIKSRLFVLAVVIAVLFGVLIQRIFTLQIINGEKYLDNYTLRIQKTRTIAGTRGNIYDSNGKLLAYNELSYSVTFEDNVVYDTTKQKNREMNKELSTLISMIEERGDSIANDFQIQKNTQGIYDFTVSGSSLKRFLADIYGHQKVEELTYNKKLGYDEGSATAEQVMEYLQGSSKFNIHVEGKEYPDEKAEDIDYYTEEQAYKIMILRYAISQNSYQKYVLTTVAQNVSEETVAVVKENSDTLPGVDISEESVRKYNDSKYFSHIIGYTGKISQEEYDELSEDNEEYTLNDVIGKSGIEQVMEEELQGKKGRETFYVDSLGRIMEITDHEDSAAGNDVYLSIDADLQKAVYDLLEQELAGIIYSKMIPAKEYDTSSGSASDIKIPSDDVYFALINNNVINASRFSQEDASDTEQQVYQTFLSKQENVLETVERELQSASPTAYNELDKEMQVYMSYILTMLTQDKVFLSSEVDKEDATYQAWKNDEISLAEYLHYAVSKDWIDITKFDTQSKYSDSTEIYEALVQYIVETLKTDKGFDKKIYEYMIHQDLISGTQLCMILFEQGVLAENPEEYNGLKNGSISAYNFIREKIKNLEITPAQLALDPCTGSCVVTDVKTGKLLACVTYPGYDTNRLANTVDANYFASLQEDLSLPMYNNATQQRTAPGSTFKPITAAAALTESVVDTQEQILDEGKYTKIDPVNPPKCWIYPNGTHGLINISEAIRDSCNYFFYEMGYRLSMSGDTYDEDKGIENLQKYATLFGLGQKTGIEIPENEPKISDEYPITSAIGQGNHNYTTTELARYVTAVASSGNVYQMTLLSKETTSEGEVVQQFEPQLLWHIDDVTQTSWDAIHSGMRMVAENNSSFENFPIAVAGKTGTAQEDKTRANHALFIGYAPYEDPQVAITTRIAYGYTSANAAEVSSNVLKYYFKLSDEESLLNGQAQNIGDSTNGFTD